MRVQTGIWVGLGVMVLTTSSLALYYRSQAVSFEREYRAALGRADRMAAAAATAETDGARDDRMSRRVSPVKAMDVAPPPVPSRDPAMPTLEAGKTMPIVAAPPPARAPEGERSRRRPSDWMENLRTNDPQRYAEFQQRRQAMQQTMQNAWVQATNYFMSRDTSKMAQAELQEYNTMLTLLSEAGSLNRQLQSGLPPEVRQQVATQLRSNIVAVIPLLDKERNREYFDAAIAMGQSEEDATTLVTYINQITSNTTLRAILPGVRMGGMPGGGPPRGNLPFPDASTR